MLTDKRYLRGPFLLSIDVYTSGNQFKEVCLENTKAE